MKITEVIERADALQPNAYTREEKLDWCYELTAMLYAEIKKVYDTIIITDGEGQEFADGILTEDIEQVWVNGKRLTKTDDRSFEDIDFSQGEIRIVYRVRPQPYREERAEGTYTFANVTDEDTGAVYGSMSAPGTHFLVHDVLNITRGEESEQRCVTQVSGDVYFFADSFSEVGEAEAVIHQVLCEETAVPPPYDVMYIDYLLGKIAFYQNDLQEYNKHMIDFNTLLDGYAKWYKQTNPLTDGVRFRNMW